MKHCRPAWDSDMYKIDYFFLEAFLFCDFGTQTYILRNVTIEIKTLTFIV